jgi:hypothetical protein
MNNKDSFNAQVERIRRMASGVYAGCSVTLDPQSTLIRYRIDDEEGNLIGFSGHDVPSVIADWSDDKLREQIREIGRGKSSGHG